MLVKGEKFGEGRHLESTIYHTGLPSAAVIFSRGKELCHLGISCNSVRTSGHNWKMATLIITVVLLQTSRPGDRAATSRIKKYRTLHLVLVLPPPNHSYCDQPRWIFLTRIAFAYCELHFYLIKLATTIKAVKN